MKVTGYLCDRCGKLTTADEARFIHIHGADQKSGQRFDLCGECAKKVSDWIAEESGATGVPDKPEKPTAKTAGQKRAGRPKKSAGTNDDLPPVENLDIGKVKALRAAGWSASGIAADMRAPESQIRSALAEGGGAGE